MPGTVGATTSAHGQTSGDGYTLYYLPPTFSLMGITSPGHVDRWYVRDGHALTSHLYNVGYYQYPFTGPRLCGSDSETQDDRFPLPQSGEMQMPVAGLGPFLAPAVADRHGTGPMESQVPVSRESQVPVYGESQVPISGENQVPDTGESQMPHEGDGAMLDPEQLAPDSPQDMILDDDQQPPSADGVGEEHAGDPATHHIQTDQIQLMGKYIFIHH
jgi:hypothetical protein